jgi:hypothetical protein
MNQYFFSIDIRSSFTEEYSALIPEQRDVINKLMQQGIVLNFSLSSDRTKSWLTVMAESRAEAIDVVDNFPIREFMTFRVDQLAFQFQANMYFPQLSLN